MVLRLTKSKRAVQHIECAQSGTITLLRLWNQRCAAGAGMTGIGLCFQNSSAALNTRSHGATLRRACIGAVSTSQPKPHKRAAGSVTNKSHITNGRWLLAAASVDRHSDRDKFANDLNRPKSCEMSERLLKKLR
jgi:hypothetical protein